MGVDIHGGSNIRMPQQFSLHLEIDVERMKQVEWLRRNVCQPTRPNPAFSAAGTRQFS
jgi:hypothetical protein